MGAEPDLRRIDLLRAEGREAVRQVEVHAERARLALAQMAVEMAGAPESRSPVPLRAAEIAIGVCHTLAAAADRWGADLEVHWDDPLVEDAREALAAL